MNGLRPLMPRSEPAGRGGAGRAADGMRNEVRARTTAVEGSASRWPTSVLTPATPTATAPVTRNRRRPGCGWDTAEAGAGPDGTQDAPGDGPSVVSSAVLGWAGPGSGRAALACPAARTSRPMVN